MGYALVALLLFGLFTGYVGYDLGFKQGSSQITAVTVTVQETSPQRELEAKGRLEKLTQEFISASELPLPQPNVLSPRVISEPELIDYKSGLIAAILLPQPPFSGPMPAEAFGVLPPTEFAFRFGLERGVREVDISKALEDFNSRAASEIDGVVNPGDLAVEIQWPTQTGQFLSMAIIDGLTLDVKYDSFMRFVPIHAASIGASPSQATNSTDEENHHERDQTSMSGQILTIFPGKTWISAKCETRSFLGTGEGVFGLAIYFETKLDGPLASFVTWFFKTGVALGSSTEGVKPGASISGQTLISQLWLDGSEVAFGSDFAYDVDDGIEVPIHVDIIGLTYDPADYEKRTSIKVQPIDPDRVVILTHISPDKRKNTFVGQGSSFGLKGNVKAPDGGRIHFEADLILTTDWDWVVLDTSRIYVWDDV